MKRSGSTEFRPTDSDCNVVGRATLCGAAIAVCWLSIGRGRRLRLQQKEEPEDFSGVQLRWAHRSGDLCSICFPDAWRASVFHEMICQQAGFGLTMTRLYWRQSNGRISNTI